MHKERVAQASSSEFDAPPLAVNRAVAWAGFLLGAASGLAMGVWAFGGPVAPPAGLADYAETSRRLLRLGHIAFFGIGYLNLLLAAELPRLPLGAAPRRAAAGAMNFANLVLPATLMGAAALPAVLYLLPVPALAATAALAITAWGAVRRVLPAAPPRQAPVSQKT